MFPVYFVLRVSKTPTASRLLEKQPRSTVSRPGNGTRITENTNFIPPDRELSGDDVYGLLVYVRDDLGDGRVELRMGISYVMSTNARKNLDAGTACVTTFDMAPGTKPWAGTGRALGRIRVEGGTEAQRTVFYAGAFTMHADPPSNLVKAT